MVALSAIQLLAGSGMALPGPAIAALGLLVAIPVCMLLGYTIERVAYRPLRAAPRLTPLFTAIGVSIVLQNVAMIVWGRNYHSVPALLPATPRTSGARR
jgi:branched-chain amino acid transport system permease protein